MQLRKKPNVKSVGLIGKKVAEIEKRLSFLR